MKWKYPINNQKQYTVGYISGCLFNIDIIDNYLNA